MDEWIKVIGNLGFPIAVASFLLIRIEKQLSVMNQLLIRVMEQLPKSNG